jgi:magnesium transporter
LNSAAILMNTTSSVPAGSPEATVGQLMRPPLGVIDENTTAAAGVEYVRRHASAELTYLYAVDAERRLRGVIVLRDLFLAPPDQPVRELMIRPPFYLTPEMSVLEAMRAVVGRHFPVYPVCRADGTMVGLVRGYALFENQVVTITAQAGKMVGVRAQEHPDTSFATSLRLRLPWLGLNLALSGASALVLFIFKGTLAQFIILAVFLPVITTQGRNSGAQTMAITLRGLTSGQWRSGYGRRILAKESLLGLVTGSLLGVAIAIAIWLEETFLGQPEAALALALVVVGGMITGCLVSCALGVTVPLLLRRLGSDPALAAGILHSNLSTVLCQGLFLGLAWGLVM